MNGNKMTQQMMTEQECLTILKKVSDDTMANHRQIRDCIETLGVNIYEVQNSARVLLRRTHPECAERTAKHLVDIALFETAQVLSNEAADKNAAETRKDLAALLSTSVNELLGATVVLARLDASNLDD